MVLDPTLMAASMITRATTAGLIDAPPHFGLSRVYSVIAEGVVTTLLDPASTVITVEYTGKPCTVIPCIAGPVVALDGLDPSRFFPLVQTQSLFIGPFATPFFNGIGGIIEYFAPSVTLTDLLAATGTGGTGVLSPGGVILNPTDCFDNIRDEAVAEDIMVVNLDHLGGNPLGTIPDPTTGVPLSLGDFFVQAGILVTAVTTQLAVELLFATKAGIPTNGTVNPLDPPIVASTITSVFL